MLWKDLTKDIAPQVPRVFSFTVRDRTSTRPSSIWNDARETRRSMQNSGSLILCFLGRSGDPMQGVHQRPPMNLSTGSFS
jgi:hypothetical protein